MIRAAQDLHRFLPVVTQLGGTVPPVIAGMLSNFDALESVRRLEVEPVRALLDAVNGPPLSPSDVADLFHRLTVPRLVRVEASQLLNGLDAPVLDQVAKALRGQAGTDLIESLRPTVDAAIAGLHAAADQFSPTATAEEVLTLGETAREAWAALADHRQFLDTLLHGVIWPLTFDLDILPADVDSVVIHRPRIMAAWLVHSDHADLDAAGGILYRGQNSFPHRAGRWLELLRTTPIRLNTPAEAIAIIEQIKKSAADAERARVERAGRRKVIVGSMTSAPIFRKN